MPRLGWPRAKQPAGFRRSQKFHALRGRARSAGDESGARHTALVKSHWGAEEKTVSLHARVAAGLENSQGRGEGWEAFNGLGKQRGEDDGRSVRGAKLKKHTALCAESARKSPVFAEISLFSRWSEIRIGLTAPSCLSVGAESSGSGSFRSQKGPLKTKLFASRCGGGIWGGSRWKSLPGAACSAQTSAGSMQSPDSGSIPTLRGGLVPAWGPKSPRCCR